jgi:hypothetical protein
MVNTLQYRQDGSQVRTRVLSIGSGTTTSAAVGAGASTIPVTDVGPFQGVTKARCGRNDITFSGTSTASGAGDLTSCSGISYDIPEQEPIDLVVQVDDSSAQSALATLLGGGLSGIATYVLRDGRLTEDEAQGRGDANIDLFGGPLEDINFRYKTPQRYARAGRTVGLNITSPLTISGTYVIQSVDMTPYGQVGNTKFEVSQDVDLSVATKALPTLLLGVQ